MMVHNNTEEWYSPLGLCSHLVWRILGTACAHLWLQIHTKTLMYNRLMIIQSAFILSDISFALFLLPYTFTQGGEQENTASLFFIWAKFYVICSALKSEE